MHAAQSPYKKFGFQPAIELPGFYTAFWLQRLVPKRADMTPANGLFYRGVLTSRPQ